MLLAPALIYRAPRAYMRDFAPFGLAVLGYEWARTLAHRINPHPFYRPQIDADEVIGLGRIPTVRLQGWLYDGTPRFFEHQLDRVHDWYFGGPARHALPALAREPARVPARRRGRARLRVRRRRLLPRLPRRPALAREPATTSSGRSSASASTGTSARARSATPRS